ncbi:Sel1 repeat-containing protein [Nitzschia inconspicua]|uniref:Sel1 repeat-containing protein n=1 Tax=Nitzschia inconspicua TaxID=303405 RepID=A0A9K3LV87_9STRA|nr:Sel1 repeat-containing protein [Nitzschia inconspicua]
MAAGTGILTFKLFLVAILGLYAVLLGGALLSLQLKITEKSLQLRLRYSVSQGKWVPISSTTSNDETEKNNGKRHDKTLDYDDGSIGSYYQYQYDGSRLVHSSSSSNNNNYDSNNRDEMHLSSVSTTTKSSIPTGSWDINLWNTFPTPEATAWKTTGEAYWRQVVAYMKDWDVAVWPADPTDYRASLTAWQVQGPSAYYAKTSSGHNNNTNRTFSPYPRLALERAAHAGHPMAQHYLANAHASGVWPVPAGPYEQQQSSATSSTPPLTEDLHVFEEWIPSAHGDHPQVTKSFLLWHMAAMAGNVESAMALAYRFDHTMEDQRSSSGTCHDALPYYQAAADGIMDQLETSLHSRAKVTPPMDMHILAQVHMHGGTSSQLDRSNKPDESKEALQFYHLKATTVPWSIKKSASEEDNEKKKKKGAKKGKKLLEVEGIDVSAAHTLGQLYHYGARGVDQNLTKSLEYYEIAALNGDWESSGHACIFHLWGMGVEQNVYEALRYCRLGAPMTLDDCRNRHQWILARTYKKNDEEYRAECNSEALNGLGLLHLMGVPGSIDVDLAEAEKYFTLAKEVGSTDAHYNLAMMWLGWKTHFKTLDELEDGQMSAADSNDAETVLPIINGEKKASTNERSALHSSKLGEDQVFKGPTQEDVNNAMKLLAVAANRGHVQAKHRLAMIYAEGIRLQTSVLKYESVKKDCTKAKGLFQWIVENASLTRSKRLKRAYKAYIAGNLEVSLRNYLAAAETGSSIGQVNAAFLMERGVCLGLNPADCAKASVRLWKAAAARGNAEACLRVGDFYYYGRLRGKKLPVGPFGWIQYLLYPEKYVPIVLDEWSKVLLKFVKLYTMESRQQSTTDEDSTSMTCSEQDGVCLNEDATQEEDVDDFIESDLQMAAHYYQVAVEKHQSARANFNLGFMHQWGLGLKQDFPLAKRHYDLAVSNKPGEAELAVQIALFAMNIHETLIRWKVLLEDWWYGRDQTSGADHTIEMPMAMNHAEAGQPVPGQDTAKRKTKEEIILSHLFNWSSVLILVLVFIAMQIIVIMRSRRRQT